MRFIFLKENTANQLTRFGFTWRSPKCGPCGGSAIDFGAGTHFGISASRAASKSVRLRTWHRSNRPRTSCDLLIGGSMKGVVLAGGTGSRLYPLTRVTNKHLLPVYDKPMLYYPVQTLVDAGIQDILIVTGGNNAGDFLRLMRNGKDFGLKQLSFAYQEGEGGIADALRLAEPFAAAEKICVILGDNILEKSVLGAREKFERQQGGALILLKEVLDTERFGVPMFEGKRIVRIEEKPRVPGSPYAVIGVYFYDGTVFDRVRV